jgi:large subunit ribosomal protein L21
MYAVIETGGKQYRVEVGTELEVELLDVEAGQSITLERVLLVADGAEATVGTPVVDGAAVEAEVLGAIRGDKVIAFKYRPKARRRVKKGHRQELTVLRINDILFGGKSAAESAPKQSKAESRKALEEAAARQAAEDAALAAKLNVASEAAEAEATAPKAKAEPRAKAPTAPLVDADPEAEAAPEAETEATASTGSTRGFEIFEDGGEWRWRLVASNGEPVAVSEQGFSSKSGVVRTLDVVRRNVAEAEGHTEADTTETTTDAAPKRSRTKKDA